MRIRRSASSRAALPGNYLSNATTQPSYISVSMALVLVCHIGDRQCAIPLDVVIETMRPLPMEPLAGAVEGVLGVAIIRGIATPVLDLAALFGERSTAQRLVAVRTGDRVAALAVDHVVGVAELDHQQLQALPPLLGDARTGCVEAIGAADSQLLIVLRAARFATALLSERSS